MKRKFVGSQISGDTIRRNNDGLQFGLPEFRPGLPVSGRAPEEMVSGKDSEVVSVQSARKVRVTPENLLYCGGGVDILRRSFRNRIMEGDQTT
jgi:hypothetical protein